jgi:hypothetical protein
VDPDFFLGKSEECFALSRAGRDMARLLEEMGNSFANKAVEIATEIDHTRNKQSGCGQK